MTIKSALISVFSKDGIDELALELAKNKVDIYSTGGTKKYLENLGLKVLAVEDYTNYPSWSLAACILSQTHFPKQRTLLYFEHRNSLVESLYRARRIC